MMAIMSHDISKTFIVQFYTTELFQTVLMLQKIKYSDEQIEDKILTRTLIHLTKDRILLTNSFISLISSNLKYISQSQNIYKAYTS